MEASVSSLKQSRVRARVCKLNILFFFLFCVSPSSPSEEVKQRGSPVADDANISPFINRTNYAIIRTATLTPSGFMYTGSNNFTTLSASPQQKQLHICREKKHCRKSTVSTKSASFLSIETRFFAINKLHQQSLYFLYELLRSLGIFIVSMSIDFVVLLEVMTSAT